MITISSEKIEEAIYKLCTIANTQYDAKLYELLYEKYQNSKNPTKYINILKNIETASTLNRPLCQDTGQVIVFAKLGKEIIITGNNIENAINNGISKAYKDNSFRLSVVKNALFDRGNTHTNTPATIYTEFSDKDEIKIDLMIKGAGSENYCDIKMFSPNTTQEEIFEFIKTSIEKAGEKACPPFVLGIGAGGTFDKAAVLSKKAFFKNGQTKEENQFLNDLKKYLNALNENILDIKLETFATHIACLPIAITINCHSTRHATCTIKKDKTEYKNKKFIQKKLSETKKNTIKINTNEIDKIKSLKPEEEILLSGEIYTARDAAHKRLFEEYSKTGKLPINLDNKIIFYAGPCPASKTEIIGPIGPTTSTRMDKFCEFTYSNGVIATIGKGERSKEAIETIKKYNGKYFTIQGGISCLIAKCITETEIIAFEDLGTEAIRKLKIKDLPIKVEQ